MQGQTGQTDALAAVDTRLERLAGIADELGDADLVAEAMAERSRLLEARFFVACVGQFKRGKSTLINALVGEPLLPVGIIPVTSVVTTLSYGSTPRATARFTSAESQVIDLDAIADFVDERRNPQNRRGVAVVDVAFPSAILRDGLCLVDTPGLGSVHAINTEAARAFVPHIDVALVVVGPDPPISGEELELVRDVAREAGELALIVNKADQVRLKRLDALRRTPSRRGLMPRSPRRMPGTRQPPNGSSARPTSPSPASQPMLPISTSISCQRKSAFAPAGSSSSRI